MIYQFCAGRNVYYCVDSMEKYSSFHNEYFNTILDFVQFNVSFQMKDLRQHKATDVHLWEITIVDYRLSFSNHGKQTSVFCFRLQQTNESFPFLFSVCYKQTEIAVFRQFHFPHMYIYMCIYIHIYIYVCCRFQQKTENGSPGNFP